MHSKSGACHVKRVTDIICMTRPTLIIPNLDLTVFILSYTDMYRNTKYEKVL